VKSIVDASTFFYGWSNLEQIKLIFSVTFVHKINIHMEDFSARINATIFIVSYDNENKIRKEETSNLKNHQAIVV
jgi:hypothetical protein